MIKKSKKWFIRECKALWGQIIHEKFNHKCAINDNECSACLNAHHIFSKGSHVATRYDLENGVLLCFHHHQEIHNGRPDVAVGAVKHLNTYQYERLRNKAMNNKDKLDLPKIYEDLKEELGKYIA